MATLRTITRVCNICRKHTVASCRFVSTEISQNTPPGEEGNIEGSRKPRTNVPFAKNFFLGNFDKQMLVYPEVLENEELEELNSMVQPIERFFTEGIDSKAIDEAAKIPDDVMQQLKDLGLFGQQIPVEYGGLELNATKYARMAEITSLDAAIAVTLAAHQAIGLKGILIAGNLAQKEKYLPKLATGEHVAAFALTEPSSGSDAASIQTRATLSEDGKTFHLNGGKIWISNGGIADIFTVFAKTEVIGPMGDKEDKVTAFVVERAFGGVTNGKPEDKMGIRGSNTCEVHFDNTPVPAENVLGEVGGGFKVAMNILNSGRFSMGSSCAGGIKHMMKDVVEHAITRTQFNQKLKDFGLIQEKFADMAMTVYAMESMAYHAAGIVDSYETPDASVEAAMVKVYSSENAWRVMSECLQIFGGLGYMRDYPYERYLRDTRILLIFEGTNEILRLYIALTGMQFAGQQLREMVKKMKNPLNNVGFIFKKGFERRSRDSKSPPLRLQLYEEVHPNLRQCAENLEGRLHNFGFMVEHYLGLHGTKIMDEQMSLKRFADIAIDLYACTAVIARASRSNAIGQKNHDHEVMLAQTFVFKACHRMNDNYEQLKLGKFENGDENYRKIAEDIFKSHGYVPEHPLDRNW